MKRIRKDYDSQATCPKCGDGGADTRYCDGLNKDYYRDKDKLCWPSIRPREHLHRECAICKYEWLERCIKPSKPRFFITSEIYGNAAGFKFKILNPSERRPF